MHSIEIKIEIYQILTKQRIVVRDAFKRFKRQQFRYVMF